MARGSPIDGMNVGSIRCVVRDRTAALAVAAAMPDTLARAVVEVFDDPALAARLAKDGLRTARTRAWDVMPAVWMRGYRSGAEGAMSRSQVQGGGVSQ